MEKIPEPDEELKKEIIKKFSPKREASELLSFISKTWIRKQI